jgi:thiol-disulfide isomerase/thioredoxin
MRARIAFVALGMAAALLLTGCSSSDKLAATYGNGTGTTNYTDDSGLPVLVKAADRADPIDFASTTDDGLPLSAKDYRGKVVIVNFWYAGCAPCRAEAPILEGLYQTYQDKGVTFIGVNVTDQPDTALSFEKTYGITYPSVIDVDSGAARIAFHGQVSASAVPVTFVLDKKGRIAARIVGQLESKSILNTLITDTIAEKN